MIKTREKSVFPTHSRLDWLILPHLDNPSHCQSTRCFVGSFRYSAQKIWSLWLGWGRPNHQEQGHWFVWSLSFLIPFLAFSAFIKIDERYAERAVQSLNNCFFFGAQIKVQFSKQNDNQRNTDNHRSSSDHRRQNLPSGLSGINVESREFDRFDPPPSRASAPPANQSARFVIDDFSQLSGQRPSCPMPRRDEIDQLITRRKRLEVRLPSLSLTRFFLLFDY